MGRVNNAAYGTEGKDLQGAMKSPAIFDMLERKIIKKGLAWRSEGKKALAWL